MIHATKIERPTAFHLQLAGVDDSGSLAVLDGAALGACGLKSLDDGYRGVVGDDAEGDVTAIEPAGLDSSNEELRAVAVRASY